MTCWTWLDFFNQDYWAWTLILAILIYEAYNWNSHILKTQNYIHILRKITICPLTAKSLKRPIIFLTFCSHVFTSQSVLSIWWATRWAVSRGSACVCRLAFWLMHLCRTPIHYVEKPPQSVSPTSTWLLFATRSLGAPIQSLFMADVISRVQIWNLRKALVWNENVFTSLQMQIISLVQIHNKCYGKVKTHGLMHVAIILAICFPLCSLTHVYLLKPAEHVSFNRNLKCHTASPSSPITLPSRLFFFWHLSIFLSLASRKPLSHHLRPKLFCMPSI